MTTDDIRQSAQEMLRATLSAEDGALAVYRMEEDGEWAEVQGFLDMGHLASEVVAWASERANREPSDAEVEAGAEAMREQGPGNTPIWDDWVWHRFARAALLAARRMYVENRRAGRNVTMPRNPYRAREEQS